MAINAAPPLTWQHPTCRATAEAAGMNFTALVSAVLESAVRVTQQGEDLNDKSP